MENYTNYPELFLDLKLNKNSEMLYMMHHAGKDYYIRDLVKLEGWNAADKIYLVDSEAWNVMIDTSWMENKKVNLFAPVIHNHPQVHVYQFWFALLQEIENYLNFNKKLENLSKKMYYFDALLGTPRKHKDIVYKFITESNCSDKFLITYYKKPNSKHLVGSDIEDADRMITFHDKMTTNTSCVIPYLIYNKCWFSLVVETNGEDLIFYSEKTGKVLLSKRIFVMFASQHHLRHLKEFGFQTFDGIVDESYDNIKDTNTRYQQAWKQVEFLLEQDPVKIYKQAEPILEHNRNHFITTDWKKLMHDKIQYISQRSK